MKKIFKQLFTTITTLSLVVILASCSIDDIKEAIGNINIPNSGGDVVETPKEDIESGIVVPPKPEPETEIPTPVVDYDYYLISGFRGFEKDPSYNMSNLMDEYGYPTINVYLNAGEEFYVMGGEKNEIYGYNTDLKNMFSECEGHFKNPVAGNYQISLIDGKVVAKRLLINESFLDHEEDIKIPVVWKNTMFRNYEGMWLDTDGARLFISVDSEGRICYMVVNPQLGYGYPAEDDYIRHSVYTSYNSNPAFAFKDIKHALITPENGFTITVADVFGDGSYADIIYQITKINILDYNSHFIVNNSGINVDDIRLSYDEKTGVVIIEEVEDETEISLGLQIQNEYNLLKAGLPATHTEWTVTGTVVDMRATSYDADRLCYNVQFIMEVDGVLIGIYNGQVNGENPKNIEGLQVGTLVTVTGTIAEGYTLTSGNLTAEIDFSRPKISWEYTPTVIDLYVRGDMNGWGVYDEYKLDYEDGVYSITLYLEAGHVFKITNEDLAYIYKYADSIALDFTYVYNNISAIESGYYKFTLKNGVLTHEKINL